MSQPLRFSDGKKDFERCSIGHQDSQNLSVQVNWLSNNGLPGLEPRGLLPTCVLFQRVSHGDLQFPQSFSLAHVGTCASWNPRVHVFLTCLAFFWGVGTFCSWGRKRPASAPLPVARSGYSDGFESWRFFLEDEKTWVTAIQHRTQSYSMFWRGRGWNGVFG